MNQIINQSMDFFGIDQPMDLLTKTKTDWSQVIWKVSRDETRQIEKYKKMGREEKKCTETHELFAQMCATHP